MSRRRSKYLLTKKQRAKYSNVAEVRISIWGVVPAALDRLVAKGFASSRAEAYYKLAMAKLMETENLRPE